MVPPTGNPFKMMMPWVVDHPAVFTLLRKEAGALMFEVRPSGDDDGPGKECSEPTLQEDSGETTSCDASVCSM